MYEFHALSDVPAWLSFVVRLQMLPELREQCVTICMESIIDLHEECPDRPVCRRAFAALMSVC